MKKLKITLLASTAILALAGGAIILQPATQSFAAEEHDDHGHEEEAGYDEGHGEEHEEGMIKLNTAQIEGAGITLMNVTAGSLAREVSVPGKIITAADRMAQIVPKVGGIVTEARKNLGDSVEKGEIVALIESREMAEAMADYLAASRAVELTRSTYNREKGLWEKKITAEQDYLNAKNLHQEASIRLDLAQQKLRALGHDGKAGSVEKSRFYELKSPITGRIIARELTLGEYVDVTHAAFIVSDLSVVWVETAIAPDDLPFVVEGQTAIITGAGQKAEGQLIFISPAIDPETRTAKAIIELDNPEGLWRPGGFATAAIATVMQEAGAVVPKEAIQTVEGKNVVFVRSESGFETRAVEIGRQNSQQAEIISGLKTGEKIAIGNTFTLKAEAGKAGAEHSH